MGNFCLKYLYTLTPKISKDEKKAQSNATFGTKIIIFEGPNLKKFVQINVSLNLKIASSTTSFLPQSIPYFIVHLLIIQLSV